MKKVILFSLLIFSLAINNVQAQEKSEKRAIELVEEMKTKFASNPDLKLTQDQETKLKEVYLAKLEEIKLAKKEVADEALQKEKIKEINKKYGKTIFETILTKEQKAYLKEQKKTAKE